MSELVSYWLSRSPGQPSEGPFSLDQLRRMHDTGSVTTLASVCRCGEETWQALGDELQAAEIFCDEAYRCTRRVKTGGDGCVALVLLVLAVVGFLFFWPLGILLLALAFMGDRRYSWVSFCGACGNTLASTSLQCPTCGTRLRVLSARQKMKRLLRQLGWWVVGGLILIAGFGALLKMIMAHSAQ